jgi:hypothetical protein
MLRNPERDWERPAETVRIDRAEVEHRIGPCAGEPEVLSGGLANANVRLGDGRILRIYRREPAALAREAALLARGWRSFVVPRLLARGPDFLLLEEVAYAPLADGARDGAALGRALAEIHATGYERAGLLGADFTVAEPFPDWFQALRDYALSCAAAPAGDRALGERVGRFLAAHAAEYVRNGGRPVLLHGDFKVSNLFWARAAGAPLVLDWEFAYAGPPLMDVGQLFRWEPSDAFAAAFAAAYRADGGQLPDGDWRRAAAAFDLVNLCGLLERAAPGSRRAADVRRRIEGTLAAG